MAELLRVLTTVRLGLPMPYLRTHSDDHAALLASGFQQKLPSSLAILHFFSVEVRVNEYGNGAFL
ncbi:hypothetical protein KCP74_16520 [Salmonella enterica subsp. enterica]|nr:hypothetical protein KCP74_16520 [Salmonella enterica subsp. enterica]